MNFSLQNFINFLLFVDSEGSGSTQSQAMAPKFETQFTSMNSVSEGQSIHLEAKLSPAEDPNLKVEWQTIAHWTQIQDLP